MVKVREGMALIMFLCSATMVYHIVGDPKRDGAVRVEPGALLFD
jgi:hypothetical protein